MMFNRWHSFKKTHEAGFRLLNVVKQIDRDLIPLSLIDAILSTAMPFVTLVFSARIIDKLLERAFTEAGWFVVWMLLTLLVIGGISLFVQYRTKLSQKVLQTGLEILIRKKGMELEYDIISDSEAIRALRNAEEAAKYNGGLGHLVHTYNELLKQVLSATTAIVFAVIFCLTQPQTGGMILKGLANPFVAAVALLAAWIFGLQLSKNQSVKIKALDDQIAEKHYIVENQIGYWISDVLYDTESGKTIRVNGMEKMIDLNIDNFMNQVLPLYKSMGISSGKRILSEGIESGLFSIVSYFFVLVKVVTGAVTIGAFTQYAGAFLQFHQASAKMVWSESEVNRITKNLVPLADYLDRTNKRYTGTLPIEKRTDNIYEIEFHDVSFRYPGSTTDTLQHINAKITLKNKLAVVGRNGAGKTTFIKLLCRLYDPTKGVITLNGIDIRKYKYDEYLSLFSVVFQDFYLFSASIAENIAISKNFDGDKVTKCLKKAGALSYVSGLEKGYDTDIENGTNEAIDLSGGQGQKISLARALYKEAPFVILDEPTAALDPISEAEIYRRFDEMVVDKTSVYISHRMSSCRFCHDILVFEKGAITERGAHDILLKHKGVYAALWNAQAQYYA